MLSDLFRLMRPAQWLKNGIIPVSLIFAGQLGDPTRLQYTILATAWFCFLSSAAYVFNDLIDREKDRQHPVKKNRPIDTGQISTGTAIFMITFLTAGALAGSWMLSFEFFIVALIFIGFNLLYSTVLKRIVIVDIMAIAMSFVIRAYAGGIAADVPASKWMIITTLLLALFLAMGKRRHELTLLEETASEHRASLSHYSPYFLDQMIGVTTASVVVIYMLYTFSPEVSARHNTENLYFTIPFVVYGIFRYLYLIHRKEKGGSPTRVLLTDPGIAITVGLWLITSVSVLYWL